MNRDITDSEAIDMITEIFREPDWSPETLDRIAEIIESTGRDISPIEEDLDEDLED